MIVKIDKSFAKDTGKINNKSFLAKVADCIEEVQRAHAITEIHNIKKLKGNTRYYRNRIGDYRLGIEIYQTTVEFIRCLPRKDIYKYFPK